MGLCDYLSEHHVAFERILHPPAFTAQKRAHFLHVPGRLVAKSVLLRGPAGPLLAVLPATLQVDTDLLGASLGGPVRLATAREVSEHFCDCEWGSAPPFGTLYGLPTILETSVDPSETLLWEGHSHAETIRMSCKDFERLEQPTRLAFARPVPRPQSA
jgi:Ala-tRNA(Pro) deacylase